MTPHLNFQSCLSSYSVALDSRRLSDSTSWFFSARASYANDSGLSGGAVVRFDQSSGSFVLIGIHTAGEYLHHLSQSITFRGTFVDEDMTECSLDENRKRSSSVESVSMSAESLDSLHLSTSDKHTVDMVQSSVMPMRYHGVTGRSIFVSIGCLDSTGAATEIHRSSKRPRVGSQSSQLNQLLYDD